MWFEIIIILGILNSLYALYVHVKLKKGSYKPFCDINKNVSCSKALGSEKGRLFGFPNPVLGLLFYPFLYFLYTINTIYALALVIFSIPFIIYLAYQLYVLRTWCLVCLSSYLVNIALLLLLLF